MSAKDELKELLKKVRSSEDVKQIKPEIKEELREINATDLSQAEQELAEEEEISLDDLRKICEPHIELMQEELQERGTSLGSGHPLKILENEHDVILQKLDDLEKVVNSLDEVESFEELGEDLEQIRDIANHLIEAESHHDREEESLFPEVERKGLTGPPKVMRREHEDYWEKKKSLDKLVKNYDDLDFREFKERLRDIGSYLISGMRDHIYKENNILYPAADDVLDESKWSEIKEKFDEMGYCFFTPDTSKFDGHEEQ